MYLMTRNTPRSSAMRLSARLTRLNFIGVLYLVPCSELDWAELGALRRLVIDTNMDEADLYLWGGALFQTAATDI